MSQAGPSLPFRVGGLSQTPQCLRLMVHQAASSGLYAKMRTSVRPVRTDWSEKDVRT